MRSRLKVGFTLSLMIPLLLFSRTVRSSILNSIGLCVHILIPSLFPFFVISGMVMDFGLTHLISPHLSSFIIGTLCGYPIGTKTVCRYYLDLYISREQAQALLSCTANASPAFVIITLGETIFGNKTIGILLWIAQFLNSFIMFLLFVPKDNTALVPIDTPPSLIKSLIQSTETACKQIIFVSGITIVFGTLCDLIQPFLKQNQQKLLGVIEILHGCNFFEPDDLMLVAVTLGFSGLCVLIQCIYYVNEAGLKVSSLIFGKVYSAILLPMYFNIFTSTSLAHKLFSILIIILTNITTMCIIRFKGCDQRYDFFKKYRKMLRLLRARNQDSI